jgi:hypothetical protein
VRPFACYLLCMRRGVLAGLLGFAGLAGSVAACGRDHDGAPAVRPPSATAPLAASASPLPPSDCGHSVCTDNLFIDAAPGARCAAGGVCSLHVTLVATGDFHVNDEYPYRFKADETSGVTFLGTDEAGKNVFTKGAGDWKKIDPKSGAMTVKFTPDGHGPATIGGVLKLSVCSGATCQLEQSRVSAVVAVD